MIPTGLDHVSVSLVWNVHTSGRLVSTGVNITDAIGLDEPQRRLLQAYGTAPDSQPQNQVFELITDSRLLDSNDEDGSVRSFIEADEWISDLEDITATSDSDDDLYVDDSYHI